MLSSRIIFSASALISSTVAAPLRRQASAFTGLSDKITHVVYLMMENHSFDNIAGYWDFRDDIDNLRNVTYCNEFTNPNWTVWNEPLLICAGKY